MVVEVIRLKKYFPKTRAVDDISFSFTSGQIVGFIGPNGAGKTTTMRIMATIDAPTSGDVRIGGVSAVQDPGQVRMAVGYMPDSLPTHRDMSVDDYLDFFARAYRIGSPHRQKVVEEIEYFTGLYDIREKYLKALSKGMKQRVSLARALIHDPSVLILDEPAAGLDPRARIELRELLRVLCEQGKGILVSSHILSELAEICNSVVIIETGKVLHAGSLEEITPDSTTCRFLIRAKGDPAVLHRRVLELPRVTDARIINEAVEIDYEGREDDTSDITTQLISDGFKIIEVSHKKVGLEDIFLTLLSKIICDCSVSL